MKNIDKTKLNIKVDKLEDKTRKELFNKFIDSGGKIIKDLDIDEVTKKKDKSKNILNRIPSPIVKNKSANKVNIQNKNALQQTKTSNIYYAKKAAPRILPPFVQKLLIRFHLYTMKITDLSGNNFNNKFFHLFKTEYKTALVGIKMLYMELFDQNREINYEIMNAIDKQNLLYSKLIDKMSKLYNENEINSILKEYTISPQYTCLINQIKTPLLLLFRKLYVLKPYEKHIYTALENSINIHMKLKSKNPSEYYLKRKNIKDDMYVIFRKLFPALYWLFCRYFNCIYNIGSPEIEILLNIKRNKTGKDKVEVNTAAEEQATVQNIEPELREIKIEENADDDIKETELQKELPEELKTGLKLISCFNPNNIQKLRTLYDNKNKFSELMDTDKILLTYFILKEFDNEYSFLLTTNKIKYRFELGSNQKNYKAQLMDFYNDIKKCMDTFTEYSISFYTYFKARNETPLSNDRYIAYTKEITTLSKRREQSAHMVRFSILAFLNNISGIFNELIESIIEIKNIIENPQDIIKFDLISETDKKLNNKTILEALTIAYNFANAFKFRLSSQGDLSGQMEFETSNNKTLGNTQNLPNGSSPEENTASAKESPVKENTDNETIIDEIDRII